MRTVCGLHMGVSEVWVEGHVPGWGPHAASTGPRVGPHVPRVGGSRQNVASPPGASRVRPQGCPRGGVPGATISLTLRHEIDLDSGRTCPRQASLSETIGAIGDGTIGAIGEVLSDYRRLSEYYRSSLSDYRTGAQAAARKAGCARYGATALACIALLVLRG